jgi:DNA primase
LLFFSFPLNKKELAIMSPKKNTHEATFSEAVIPEELQSTSLVDINSFSLPSPNHNVREKLKGSAITFRNIDNLGIGSVNLYEGNTVSYREVKKDVDLSDFYEATSAEFTKISSDKSVISFWEGLKSDKDLKWHHSPLSNSEYLVNHHTGDIYRFSDHWGKVASCEWSLNDDPTEGWSIGVANIKSFKSLPFSRGLVLKSSFVNQLNQVIANLHDIIDSTDIKKTDSALRTLNKRLDDLKSHKASLKDWKVYIENANLIKSKDISDMAYKKTNAPSSASSSYSDAVIQQFADMMIKRMEDMKESNWKKGWMDGRGDAGFPRNALTGRQYNGINPFMLMYDTIKHEYTTSMYLTARQLFSMNDSLKDPSTGKIALENLDKVMKINKGEKAFPVYYMIHKYKDTQGKEFSDQEYNDLSEEQRKDIKAYFYPKVHHLFNIDQTNMKEVNPSLYNSFVDKYTKRPSLPDSEGMYINEEIDSLLAHSKPSVWKSGKDNLSWYCPIEQTDNISSPHYNLSKDFIKVPLKNQYKTSDSNEGIFADGQEFYATLLHEMAHSTGPKGRLNRDLNGSFGDKKYAKEELVAELSAALISSTMGFDKRINDNNAKYVSSWLKVLKEEPSFIKTVLSDVGKASDMIIEKIDEQRVDLNQTLLRGSNLKGQDNELSNSSRPGRTENEMSLNELIDYQVETDTGNRTEADTNHYDDKRLYLPLLVDGKTSHLAVETVVPDAITAPSYQRTVYNFGDEVETKVDNIWQKWEDISKEYNLSAEDADRSVVDSDAPLLKFRSVDSAVKFADWITAKYAKTEQKSESTELIYSNGKQRWDSFDSFLKAAKEHQITRSEFMAMSALNTVKDLHPHNFTQSAIEYLQQQHKGFTPEEPIAPGSPLYDAIRLLKEGKVFAEYRENREVDLSSSIKDGEMLSAEEIEKLKAMALDASYGKSKSSNIDNKPLIEKVPYGEFYLPDWSIPYFKDNIEDGLSAEQLKTVKDFEKDFPSKLSIEITESSIEGKHNTELGPATTVDKAKIYYFEQHISDLFSTDESTRDRLDKDFSEDNKSRKTLSDLQAQYSIINTQYPAAVNDERTHQLAKRIRQAEQIITAYNANVEAVYGHDFMFSEEATKVMIPQSIYSGQVKPLSVIREEQATPIEESLSTKTETGISSSEGISKVDLQSQWGNIRNQIAIIAKKERQNVNYDDVTKDISLARDYIANNFQVSRETFDKFSDSDKERLVSLYSNYSSSILSSFTEERKVEKEISNFILLGGLLDPENAQKVLEKGYEKMTLLRETPNVNLAVLKSSVLSLADNQHRESNPITYGQYDIPIWAVKHLSEGKDSSLSETKLSQIESFKSQLPNNSFFEFKDSNVSYSEKPAFGPATNVIKAHVYVSRDQHQEESVSINKSVNNSEEYTMARKEPQQDSKKNEEIFYSSVVSIKSGEDLQLFDSMREKGHLNKMLKVAAEYDSGKGISLDATHKSPLQNSGDEVLRENKNYAVVYNNSAGGAYEIFRKSPQSEILNSINHYGLPDTASEDVKSLSGRKDYSSDHDLYEATQHEDHDALNYAAASRGMTPKQMEESLAAGTEERLPDSSELDKKRGFDDREKEIELKNEELSGEVSSKQELQDKNAEARRKEESQREAEKKEKEKQESQKKDDSSAKIITAAFLRSSLLSTALLSAKDNNRVWLNADGKKSPTFHQASWDISPYNQIFMSLNSDKNGYATNVYTTFKHEDSLAVKKGSESLPYSWTDWSMYKSTGPEPKSITSNQYENLSPDEKEHFKKAPVKFDRKIFNIDQTVLKGANPEQYNAVLKEHDTHYKEMQIIASTDSVDLVSDRVSKIKKQHPDHLVLFAHNGVYKAFGKDAKTIHQLAKDSVTLDSFNNSKSNRKTSIAYFKLSDLDKVLKAVVSSGQRVAVAENSEGLNAPKEATKILSKAESVLDNYSKSTGINVQKSLTQPTSYDKETDTIILNNKKSVNPGSELRTAVEKSNAIYFAISQSVANNKRLDISNQFSMPEKDIESVKQLIATVSAGVLSLKQAHPATLSDQVSNESVESWVQDIKNDPHLLSSLERNVNNTVNTIEKLVKGEQVDYAAINGKSSYIKAESFNLLSELNEVVNTSTMSAAVIRNNDGKSASVILSKGIESISENGVLNNEAFRQALLKQGVKEVKFFNPGGTLGLNKGDSYFEDKSIQIVNFDGKEVVPQQELHLNEQSQNVEHDFEDVSAVKDDNNRWHLYIKEKDQPYFIIQPEMRDMSRLFEAFKSQDQQAIYDTKISLGEKYTKIVQQRPELKVDFLMPKVPAEDITRIEKANIARDAQDKNKYLIFATIDGKGYHHEISREDFRRMWKVDNMQSYKSALAAKVFSNVLHEGQTVSEAPSVEENQQIKETNSEKVDSPKQSTESEENLSPRVGRSH